MLNYIRLWYKSKLRDLIEFTREAFKKDAAELRTLREIMHDVDGRIGIKK